MLLGHAMEVKTALFFMKTRHITKNALKYMLKREMSHH